MSKCYLCNRPTDDWQKPCVCGSRAFYRGQPLKGRMPDFGEGGNVFTGAPWEYSEEYRGMFAPAFLLGTMPRAPAQVVRMIAVQAPASNSNFIVSLTTGRNRLGRRRGKTRVRREEVA